MPERGNQRIVAVGIDISFPINRSINHEEIAMFANRIAVATVVLASILGLAGCGGKVLSPDRPLPPQKDVPPEVEKRLAGIEFPGLRVYINPEVTLRDGSDLFLLMKQKEGRGEQTNVTDLPILKYPTTEVARNSLLFVAALKPAIAKQGAILSDQPCNENNCVTWHSDFGAWRRDSRTLLVLVGSRLYALDYEVARARSDYAGAYLEQKESAEAAMARIADRAVEEMRYAWCKKFCKNKK